MKLKSVSDGSVYNTRVIDAETGEPLRQVKKVTFVVEAGRSGVTAIIECINMQFELTGRFSQVKEKSKRMSQVRAKFTVTKVAELGNWNGGRQEISKKVSAPGVSPEKWESTGIPVREVTMSAVYGGSEENRSFAEATPTGMLTFTVSNPACSDHFKVGDAYYLDFTKVE